MMPSRQPRSPSIGFTSCSRSMTAWSDSTAMPSSTRQRLDLGRLLGQELVQRRIEQPDGDREALHRAEDRLEIASAASEAAWPARAARPARVLRDDHLPHRGQPIAVEEHVLGPAEADALRAEIAAAVRVGRGVGVDAHAELPDSIGPLHQSRRSRRSAPASPRRPARRTPCRCCRPP